MVETSRHRQLSRDECLARLHQAEFGRLVLSVDCLPSARPVHISVADNAVLIALNEGPELEAAHRRDVVALQIDGVDDSGRNLWWVLVTGTAKLIEESDESGRVIVGPHGVPRAGLLVLPIEVLQGETTMVNYH